MIDLSRPDAPASYDYIPEEPLAESVVTIITFCRNDEQLDWDALWRSLQHQSLQSWRWVICCVGTTRPPAGFNADPRVTQVCADEQAPSDVISLALRDQVSPFVGLLDGRSCLEPTFLEKGAWLLATNPGIGFCNTQARPLAGDGPVWAYGFEQGSRFFEHNFAGPTWLIRRELLGVSDLAAIASGRQIELWRFWITQASRGHWGYTLSESLIRYPYTGSTPSFWSGERDDPEIDRERRVLRQEFAGLMLAFPLAPRAEAQPYVVVPDHLPIRNSLSHPDPGQRRRILILMPWLIVGGAERVNLDLIRQLRQLGYEVTLATTLRDVAHPWLGAFLNQTPDIFVLSNFLRLNEFPRFLYYLIVSRKIDVVMVSNSYLGYQLLPYLCAYCPEVTFVDYLHSHEEQWKNGGYPRCGVAYQEQIDLNIAASDYVRQWMIGRGACAERIEVCYTNVDVDKWQRDAGIRAQTRIALGLNEDQLLIVFVGRLSQEKRPTLLAQIIRHLRQLTGPTFLCLVLGDGPERPLLEQTIIDLQIGDVIRVLGRIDDNALSAYLSSADVFLLPSQIEGVSVATFEAMAMGLVPVVSSVGGQSELVTPECGFLIPLGDHEVDAYIGALSALVRDPARCRTFGLAARQRVAQHFPLSSFGPRMAALFERARANHASYPRQAISLRLAREYAAEVIEHTRVDELADILWSRQQALSRQVEAFEGRGLTFRAVVFAAARHMRDALRPLYYVAVRGGITWLIPLKERLRTTLLRRI
jgi:glycosyltransferase involved in cell wall biosynthesis